MSNLPVFDGKAIGNRIVGGVLKYGPDGRTLDELKNLIINAFLGVTAQIGQYTPGKATQDRQHNHHLDDFAHFLHNLSQCLWSDFV